MKTVLLAGASGHLGRAIAHELQQRDYRVRALVRSPEKAAMMRPLVHEVVVADATRPETLAGVGEGVTVVVSALGKSTVHHDRDAADFLDVDLRGNLNLLEAVRGLPLDKFLYVSAFGTQYFPRVSYFRAHHEFAEALAASGLPYTVVKPVTLFAAFLDLLERGQQQRLVYLGSGAQRTNPIWEGDLARICVDALPGTAKVIEAGGEEVYTRKELVRKVGLVAGGRAPRSRSFLVARAMMLMAGFANRNRYHQLAFQTAVAAQDLIAPRRGTFQLERYLVQQVNRNRTVHP